MLCAAVLSCISIDGTVQDLLLVQYIKQGFSLRFISRHYKHEAQQALIQL